MKLLQRIQSTIVILCISLLTQCSNQSHPANLEKSKLTKNEFYSFDGDFFPYQVWIPRETPKLVIIGIHGISGASSDFTPLARHLSKTNPNWALYAAECRGQGRDPIKKRRGHIEKKEDWFNDLLSFTRLVRKKHPDAKIVWCGESMGSLIALHAYGYAQNQADRCDALILSSPIVGIRQDFPRWKENLAHTAAFLFPTARISLETLAGKKEVQVTKDSVHQEQALKNPYHIERHTLRLLSTLGKMIRGASQASQKLDLPVLILHGGKDVFSAPADVQSFVKALPEAAQATQKFFPDCFHLLFYDHKSDLVLTETTSWLKKLQNTD